MKIDISDDKAGLQGYIVIDSFVDNSACGGMRVAEDLTLDEVTNLARGMTRKYAFILSASIGGGKAGIKLPCGADDKTKVKLLQEFARRIRPIVKRGVFFPLTDMNIREKDLRMFYQEMDIDMGKYVNTGYYTGLSVYCSFLAAKKINSKKGAATVAIEGAGSVGISLLKFLAAENICLVSVSTLAGALYSQSGLNIAEIITLQEKFGDDFVNHYPTAMKIPLKDVLELDVDYLFPCARPNRINNENISKVRAKWIIPGANDPVADDAIDALNEYGITALPDFVCNCGGIGGGYLDLEGVQKNEIERLFKIYYIPVIDAIIKKAHERKVSPYRIALEILKTDKLEGSKRKSIAAAARKAYYHLSENGFMPKHVKSWKAKKNIIRNLNSNLEKLR